MARLPDADELRWLYGEVEALRSALLDYERASHERLTPIADGRRASARNLLHYLALRQRDIRPLQARLAAVGLSSLGRAESCVLATVDAVRAIVAALLGEPISQSSGEPAPVDCFAGRALLAAHAEALLGPVDGRHVRTMVTLPSEAARDSRLVDDLVGAGLGLVRVNCAHDDARAWAAMIAHVRAAERATRRTVRVEMDLGGPKIRTGELVPGPAVIKLRPRRDELGRVVDPALALLAVSGVTDGAMGSLPVLPVADSAFLARLAPGESIRLTDARGRARALIVRAREGTRVVVQTERTAYVVPGTILHARGATTVVGPLPRRPGRVELRVGQHLFVTRPEDGPGSSSRGEEPARVPCMLPAVFAQVRPGEPISFDDGVVTGVVLAASPNRLEVEVLATPEGGARLRSDKGINLPESALDQTALTPRDEADLAFVAEHADLVGLSFAERPEDVARLRELLASRRRPLGIVLKIETRRGFESLPALLLEAMRGESVGVMIARGDLAVECGWERLAELQEEILWVSEAAHVPVIWATQVLETMTREGRPSRAEITDAAMAERAECVMLNKGPYIVDALRTLSDIVERMAAHQTKKRAMLRPLALASRL